METRKITPLISSIFSALTICNIGFWIWKNSKLIFSCSPAFCPFLSVKYFNLRQKLLIWIVHNTFPERRQPEVTKNVCYIFSPKGNLKKASAHGLTILPSYDLWTMILIKFFSRFFAIFKKLEDVSLKLNIFRKIRVTEINSSQWNMSVVKVILVNWCKVA